MKKNEGDAQTIISDVAIVWKLHCSFVIWFLIVI